MKTTTLKIAIITVGVLAMPAWAQQSRDFPQPCAVLFPKAAAALQAAQFQTTASDAAGGILEAKFAGEPMVYNFMVKHATPFVAKYVQNGAALKNKFRGLTFTTAAFAFAPSEGGCKVTLTVGLAGLDTKPERLANNQMGWVRTSKPLPSSGVAEAEVFDRIGAK